MDKLLFVVYIVSSKVLHHFGFSHGQVIFDYLGGQDYAVNGLTTNIDSSDVYFVSRGAYFECCKKVLSIPIDQFSLAIAPFSMALWVNSMENDGTIAIIYGTYILQILTVYNKERIKVNSPFGNFLGEIHKFPNCNLYIVQWLHIFISISEGIKVSINGVIDINENGLFTRFEIYTVMIGNSLNLNEAYYGLMWYLMYSFSSGNDMTTIGGLSTNCLLGSCSICTVSIYDSVLSSYGCLDNNAIFNVFSTCPSICFTSGKLRCINNACLTCTCGSCFTDLSNVCSCKTTAITNSFNLACMCFSGSYYNENANACSECHQECATCSQSILCETCKDLNAKPSLTAGCICKDGYWGSAPLTFSTSCQPCHLHCKICTMPYICIECYAINSVPDPISGCKCTSGFYNTAESNTEISCMPCNSNCLECQVENACTTCKSLNSTPDENGFGCNCMKGYYNTTQLTIAGACLPCYNDCSECNSENICLSCKDSNALPIQAGCQCKNGFFRPSSRDSCLSCNLNCLTCDNPSSCKVCKDSNAAPLATGTGCACLAGYYNFTSLNTAGACIILSECLEFNEDSLCIKCNDANAFVNSTGKCECKIGFVGNYPLLYNNSCEKCTKNCLKCQSSLFYQCINCNSSYFYGMCMDDCPLGYHKGESVVCIGDSFSSPVLKFAFDSIGSIFNDKFSNLSAVVKNNILLNSTQPIIYKTIPERGIFLQNAALEIGQINNRSLLSAQTSISAWLRPNYNSSTFIYKGNHWDYVYKLDFSASSIKISLKIDSLEKICHADSPVTSEAWNHFYLGLNYTSHSQASIFHNGIKVQSCTFEAPFLDYLNSSLYIGVNLNTSNFFNGYIYEYAQFSYQPSIYSLMSTNCNGCGACLITGTCISTCSYNQFFSSTDSECIDCSGDCTNGCIMTNSCNVCVDAACIKCNSFGSNSCSKCMDTYEAVNGICSKCGEGTYFDYVTRKCEKCKGLCVNCITNSICLSCKENSGINSNKTCQCISGFIGDEICERDYFKLWITVKPDNSLNLIFSEALATKIYLTDIIIKINKTDQTFVIVKYDDSNFVIQISFTEDISERNKEIQIEILKNLTSTSNKLLLSTSYSTKLFISNITSISQKLKQRLAAAKMLGSQGATAGAALSLGFSLLNFDPSTIFNFMNTAEMFYIVYLLNIELDPALCEFLLATRLQSKIPNIFSLFISSNKGVALGSHYIDYGYKTSMFLLNTGVHFTMLLIFLTLGLLLFLINFNSWIKVKLLKVTNLFKYSIFLRLWLQVYLELSISAVISLKYIVFSNPEQIIDFFISILVISLNIFGILFLISLLRIRIRLIDSPDSAEFISKYSTIFEEFKDNGLNSWLFYLMFVVKRFIVVICYCFIQDGTLQLLLLFTVTLTLSFYTISTRCFKVSLYNYYQALNEILISLFYITLVFKRLPENKASWATTTDFCIKLIFIAWGLNICYSLSVKILKIADFVRDFIKARRARLPIVEPKIIPITEAH